MVEPDLDDARWSVVAGSHSSPNRVMAAGSVVSSTWSRGRPAVARSVRASTSGNRLDPPMPITRTCSIPSTSWSHRLARAGRSACTSAITGIHPKPVGQLGGIVAPEGVVAREEPGDRVAVEQIPTDVADGVFEVAHPVRLPRELVFHRSDSRNAGTRARGGRSARFEPVCSAAVQESGGTQVAVLWRHAASERDASAAAAKTSSTTASVCASPGNITSYAPGARATPRSSMAWKNAA